MTDGHRELAAAEALGSLTPEQSEQLVVDLERDPALARELEEYLATVSVLEAAVARETPSHDLLAGILAEIEPEADRPAPPARSRGWSWRRALPAFALGAARPPRSSQSHSHSDRAAGSARPTPSLPFAGRPSSSACTARLGSTARARPPAFCASSSRTFPPRPRASTTRCGYCGRRPAAAMEAVGVFDPTTPDVRLELGLPGAGDYVAVDISVEPDAGPPEHSGTSLASGTFNRGTT